MVSAAFMLLGSSPSFFTALIAAVLEGLAQPQLSTTTANQRALNGRGSVMRLFYLYRKNGVRVELATSRTFYHRTSRDNAQAILKNGFSDGVGNYGTEKKYHGVWISDRPLDENKGAEGDTLLRFAFLKRKLCHLNGWRTESPTESFMSRPDF